MKHFLGFYFDNDKTSFTFGNKYFSLHIWKIIDFKNSEWNIEKPLYNNWERYIVNTPFFTFVVKGYLFFGKKPDTN